MFKPASSASLPLLLLSLATFTVTTTAALDACPTTTTPSYWQPTAGATWNIALSTNPTTFSPNISIYDLDLFGTTNTTIASLHASGHKVICYYSAGSYEDWRPDAPLFPNASLGNGLDGWAGERWLDTTNPVVRYIMTLRLQMAKQKGCDGVDPDNIDGYQNNPGFPLTTTTAADYVTFLSAQAHALGMSSGLKNGGDIVSKVINVTDWEVNEQCAVYSECSTMLAYIKQNKPVFHIEYTEATKPTASFVAKSCTGNTMTGFSSLIKHMALGTWTSSCPNGTVVPF